MNVERIPLFPLDVVLFPGEMFGLHVFEERYLLMAEEVLAEDLPIGIVLARPDQPEDRIEFEPEDVGTAAIVVGHEKLDDRYLLTTVGARRFRIVEVVSEKPYQEALVEWLHEEAGDEEHAMELADDVVERIVELGGAVDWNVDEPHDPVLVSHAVAAAFPFDLVTKQRLLEAASAEERLSVEAALLSLA